MARVETSESEWSGSSRDSLVLGTNASLLAGLISHHCVINLGAGQKRPSRTDATREKQRPQKQAAAPAGGRSHRAEGRGQADGDAGARA